MQKQYRLGIPSFITVETEDGSWIGEKDAQKTEKDDVVVTYETTPEAEEVWLTADQTKVKTIKLRWNTPVDKKSRILGGSWERTCLLYTSPSPRDKRQSRMPSSA